MPDLDGPLVSVMIPAFNAAGTLEATLRSVCRQSWRPLQVVIIDDGSTDETLEMARSWRVEAESAGIEVVLESQGNQGLIGARRAGLRLASGEFLQFLDADDLIHPEKLRICAELARERAVDVVVPRTRRFRDLSEISEILEGEPFVERWPRETIDGTTLCSNLWHSAGPVFRRSVVDAAGGFPNDVNPVVEELEFHGRVKLLKPEVQYVDRILSFYRVGNSASVTGQLERLYRGRVEGSRVVRELLEKNGVTASAEWKSLSVMALRTSFQLTTQLPNEDGLLDEALEEWQKASVKVGSGSRLVAAVVGLVGKRGFKWIVPLAAGPLRKRLRRQAH